MTTCSSCGALVFWSTSYTTGKRMILDPEIVQRMENDAGPLRVVRQGMVVKCRRLEPGEPREGQALVEGREDHHATCPQSKERKGR